MRVAPSFPKSNHRTRPGLYNIHGHTPATCPAHRPIAQRCGQFDRAGCAGGARELHVPTLKMAQFVTALSIIG